MKDWVHAVLMMAIFILMAIFTLVAIFGPMFLRNAHGFECVRFGQNVVCTPNPKGI